MPASFEASRALTAPGVTRFSFESTDTWRQTAKNVSATAFWRKTIGTYTGGRFDETWWEDERWRGPVQSFDPRRL